MSRNKVLVEIDEQVSLASTSASNLWSKPLARAYRRAYASGYWMSATINGGRSRLSLHIDRAQFVALVDAESYAMLKLANNGGAS